MAHRHFGGLAATVAATAALLTSAGAQLASAQSASDSGQIAQMVSLCDFQTREAIAAGPVTDMEGNRQVVLGDSATVTASMLIGEPLAAVQRVYDKWKPYETRTGALGAVARYYTCIFDIRVRQLERRPISQATGANADPSASAGSSTQPGATPDPSVAATGSAGAGGENYADPGTYTLGTRAAFEAELKKTCASEQAAHLKAWAGLDDPLKGDAVFATATEQNTQEVNAELAAIGSGPDATTVFQRCVLKKRLEQLARKKPADKDSTSSTAAPAPGAGVSETDCLRRAGITDPNVDPFPPRATTPGWIGDEWVESGGPAFEASCSAKRVAMHVAYARRCMNGSPVIANYQSVRRLTDRTEILERLAGIAGRRANQPSDWNGADVAHDNWVECLLNTRLGQIP